MRFTTAVSTATILGLLATAPAPAQTPIDSVGPPADSAAAQTLRAVPLVDDIELDGRLDEAIWQQAPLATGFTQREPDPGAAATRETEVRVLYGEGAIYVGARLYDDPDSITAQLTRRDEIGSNSDLFLAAFDSYNDNRTAFVFAVNPRGVQLDLRLSEGSGGDDSWDAVWEVETQTDSLGWTAEFRIPLSQLRYSTGEDAWGVEFQRVIARRNERVLWAPIPPDAGGFVSLFGALVGLDDLATPTRLELEPYAVSRLTRAPGIEANPFYSPNELSTSVGADFQYGLSSALTLTGTINPDFGQVEADPSVVNLTAFETFFPERRPFFVEGADIFDFDIGSGQLFYSRRIGAEPHGFAPGGAVFREVPEQTTILGAAKLSGKTADGWSIGVLDAVTAEEEAAYTTPEGLERRARVEPLTSYGVARIIRDFREGESALGAIFTATNRDLEAGGPLSFLRSAAYAGGLDGRHRFGGGDYEVSGSLVGSQIRGSEEAIRLVQLQPGHYFQRPDAEHLDVDPELTSLSGWSGSWSVRKIGGGNWGWGSFGHAVSPGFEVDDLGFQRQADEIYTRTYVTYTRYEPTELFRRAGIGVHAFGGATFGGERTETGFNTNGYINFHNYWTGYGGITRNLGALSVSTLRGGPALVMPGEIDFYAGFNTDERKILSGNFTVNASSEDQTSGHSLGLHPRVQLRPSPRLEFSLGPSVSWNTDPAQYIDQEDANGEIHYILGRLEQTTTSLTARLNYTFSPELSFEFYAQPFISAGAYSRFKEVADPKADDFDDRFRLFADAELRECEGFYGVGAPEEGCGEESGFAYRFRDPEFNFRQLNSNAVLRWEYRPGSTLFVVWNSGRSDFVRDGGFDLRDDAGDLFGAEGTNILLVKLSYWFGL